MKVLFIHQNMPGQFKHLAPALARDGHDVRFLTKRANVDLPGVTRVNYRDKPADARGVHAYVRRFDASVRTGQQAARALVAMRGDGYAPDLVIGHPGWGETMFVKDVFPAAKLIGFAEFYYRAVGADIGFEPSEPATLDTACRARARNMHLLAALEACDVAVAPTQWQRSVHPSGMQDKIEVIFDGIDTDLVAPRAGAGVTLPGGKVVRPGDKVVTYVARNLEPYRGFPTFVRAIPHLQRLHPDAEVLIVGGDGVSYGSRPPGHPTWREAMLAEVSFDRTRVHFLGKLPYSRYLDVLRTSMAHVYLTYPFVLSWSFMEAMSCGALVIGSDTAPVREVIADGRNGLLTDFFDAARLAKRIGEALARPGDHAPLRVAARATVVERYGIQACLGSWRGLIERTAPVTVRKRRVFEVRRSDAA